MTISRVDHWYDLQVPWTLIDIDVDAAPKPIHNRDLKSRTIPLGDVLEEKKPNWIPMETYIDMLMEDEAASDKQIGGNHYKNMSIQPGEFITKNEIPWYEANCIKYVCRHKQKGGSQDLDKAIHYLQLAKELYYNN